jgi:hypothetical protein
MHMAQSLQWLGYKPRYQATKVWFPVGVGVPGALSLGQTSPPSSTEINVWGYIGFPTHPQVVVLNLAEVKTSDQASFILVHIGPM